MSEAQLLDLARTYYLAATQTDLIGRIGFNSLLDTRTAMGAAWDHHALDGQLDRFQEALHLEEAALAALQAAREEKA